MYLWLWAGTCPRPSVYDAVMYQDERGSPSMQRVTVEEAARLLGIEKESVRKRVYRGSLRADKEPDGTLRVYVDGTDVVQGQSTDTVHGHESGGLKGEIPGDHGGHRDALIDELRAEVAAWREESRRKDHIIAALVERVPQLEAPREAADGPLSASEGDPGVNPRPAHEEAQGGSERRSWWRRWLEG